MSGCALTTGANNGTPPPIQGALTISTSSLPQGKLQSGYQASLDASGGTKPYTWGLVSGTLPAGLSLTSSSGTISGTPTEVGKSTFTVGVQDASSPIGTAQASMTIDITNASSALEITTLGLPSGVVQTTYAASLSASGGTAPYSWTIASGKLPGGVTLSTSGNITGTPTETGYSNFVVQVADSSSPNPQTATQDFGITISSPTQPSGPYTSRTDFGFIPLPVPLPSVGGATGAGTCITQPGYNNLVCRATDIATLGSNLPNQQEFSTCCGGWADHNAWNTSSTMFFVETGGSGLVAMSFDPATQAIAPLYGQPVHLAHSGSWSYSNPQLAYTLDIATGDPVIASLTFSSQTSPPQPADIADLATILNCVPALAGNTGWEELSFSHDEQTFVVGVGTGIQNTAIYAIVYSRANGCRWYNTQTGQIGGNWGPTGQATTSDRYTLHSVRISGDGHTILLGPGDANENRHFWTINSLQVTSVNGDVNNGHFAIGYSGLINSTGHAADGTWCKLGMAYRTFTNLLNPTYVIPSIDQCGDTEIYGDDHASWNNDDTSDQQPFFTSTVTIPLGTLITTAWQNEILGFSMTNLGTVWRFLSTYSTGTSQFFDCQNGIGTVSQDGKWFIFTSDWGNTLGLDSAGNNRCDVFVGQLK